MDGAPLPELFDWAAKLGPAGFFLIGWWLERKERIAKEAVWQARYDAVVDRFEKQGTDNADAIRGVRELLLSGRPKSGEPSP